MLGRPQRTVYVRATCSWDYSLQAPPKRIFPEVTPASQCRIPSTAVESIRSTSLICRRFRCHLCGRNTKQILTIIQTEASHESFYTRTIPSVYVWFSSFTLIAFKVEYYSIVEQRGSDFRPAARDLPSSVISLMQWINAIICIWLWFH